MRATRVAGVFAPRRAAGGRKKWYMLEYLPENHLTESACVYMPKKFFAYGQKRCAAQNACCAGCAALNALPGACCAEPQFRALVSIDTSASATAQQLMNALVYIIACKT